MKETKIDMKNNKNSSTSGVRLSIKGLFDYSVRIQTKNL